VLCLGGFSPRVSRDAVAPEKNDTRTTREQHKSRTFYFLPAFFSATSRVLPECTPHSKVIQKLMRFGLRLFFPSFSIPCLLSGNICLIWSFRWCGGGANLFRAQVPEMDRR
jgi:hypothetical protein